MNSPKQKKTKRKAPKYFSFRSVIFWLVGQKSQSQKLNNRIREGCTQKKKKNHNKIEKNQQQKQKSLGGEGTRRTKTVGIANGGVAQINKELLLLLIHQQQAREKWIINVNNREPSTTFTPPPFFFKFLHLFSDCLERNVTTTSCVVSIIRLRNQVAAVGGFSSVVNLFQ